MTRPKPKDETEPQESARKRSRHDDAASETERQIDDNQDELGRDANDPDRMANDINRTGH